MDKSLALWRMKSSGHGSCAAQAEEVVRLNPAGAPIFSLAAERAALGMPTAWGCSDARRVMRNVANRVRTGGVLWAPTFSLAAERTALGTPSLFLVLWSADPRLRSLPGLPSSA